MIPLSKALKFVNELTERLGSEKIDLSDSVSRILAEEIVADTDMPPFDRSQMDGYAVVSSDAVQAPVTLKIVGESAAGRGWDGKLKRGEAVRIMTGARVPAGADTVVKVEVTREADGAVEVSASVAPGTAIVRRAAEIKKGTTIFSRGTRVTENMIAPMAAFGYDKVRVGRQPRVAILGTGSEIVDLTKKPGRDQIRNSNSIMLTALCGSVGALATPYPIVGDHLNDLRSQISDSIRNADILVTTGGVSVGKYDLTKLALEELGAEIFFEKVRLKPGKPTVFARLGKTLVFGLPGNPVSAAVTFHVFVRKALLIMQGASNTDAASGHVVLGADARAARERDTYLPSRLDTDRSGRLVATPLRWLGSSDFVSYSQADCLVFLKRGEKRAKGGICKIIYL